MRVMRALICSIILLLSVPASATHIIGGFLSYEYLGNDQYRITLKVYRDCFGGQAPFDNPAPIAVFRSNGTLVRTLTASPIISRIQPTINNPCLVIPPQICVEEGLYTVTTTLPPVSGGYTLVYQRCCRNNSIINLFNPGDQGATYFAEIPDTTVARDNTSPVFKEFPPIAICLDEPLIVDQSATDADGDSLAYEFCASYRGASVANPAPNPPSPPPYGTVIYTGSYTAQDPMDANPALHIDSVTGLLTATPNMVGQYVVGICVKEYRNGQLIGTYLRDFQFNVVDCPDLALIGPLPDTFKLCRPFEITFDNQSTNANDYLWNFGDPTTTNDTSTLFEPTYTYPDTGTYQLTLYAENDDGCKDTAYATVHIRQALNASFDYTRVCPGEPVQFSDVSTSQAGTIISWKWYFGDGDSSTAKNPIHTYAGSGPYQVTLKILTDQNCEEEITGTVTFHRRPVANFTRGTPCLFKPTQFTDQSTVQGAQIANWQWDFGDGGATSTQQNPAHTYNQPGVYTVTLIVTSDQGCKDTIQKPVEILNLPDAEVAFSDTSVCRLDQVQLVASGGLFYEWKPSTFLNNPNIANPTAQPNANIVYTVYVSDSCHTDSAFVTVNLLPEPTPDFTYSLNCVGEPISFFDQSTPGIGNIANWFWQFGDGGNANIPNPTHVYNGNGPFNVTLTVTNDTGCSKQITKTIAPYTLPDVNFGIESTPCLDDPVTFNDLSTTDSGTVVSWLWKFGDGSPFSTDTNATHTYTIPGQYTVTLIVSTSFGCVDSMQKTVTINPFPLAGISNDTSVCPDEPVQLQATGGLFYDWRPATGLSDSSVANPIANPPVTTTYTVVVSDSCYADSTTVTVTLFPEPTADFQVDLGCTKDTVGFIDNSITPPGSNLVNWDWDFGDGQGSSIQSPIHIYGANGTYNVTLVVTNDFTCQSTITKPVTPFPIADTDFEFDSIPCLQEPIQFIDLSTLVSGNISNWNWDFGDGSTGSTQQNPIHIYNAPGSYTVQLITTTDNGCLDTLERPIQIDPFVEAQVSPDTSICSLDVAILRATGGLYYEWRPSALTNPDSNAITTVSPPQTTVFTVTVSDNCSADSAFVEVEVYDLPDVDVYQDTSIFFGERAYLEAIVGPAVTAYQWEPAGDIVSGTSTSSNIEVQPDTIKWYTVEVTDVNGCRNKDSALVDFLDPFIAIPNAFTPNGDNLNDKFHVITRGAVDLISFRVYNRWGQVVFETNGLATPQNGWDGTFKGEEQPLGNYTYVINWIPVLLQAEPMQEYGSVTLIR